MKRLLLFIAFTIICTHITQAQQTFTASAGGGLWAEGSSWEGGISPGFNVSNNATVIIPADRNISLFNPALINNGTIQISGTLQISSGSGSVHFVTITNNGNMTVNAGGNIFYVDASSSLFDKDTITNNGTFINSGLIDAPSTTLTQRELINTSTGIFRNLSGIITRRLNLDVINQGTMENTGSFNGLHSLINSGSVTNTSGALNIDPGGPIAGSINRPNDGIGRFDNLAGGTLINAGTINITNKYGLGFFTSVANQGIITNQAGGAISIVRPIFQGALVFFTNDATFNNGGTLTNTNAVLTNNGQLTSTFFIFNNGTLTNNGTMSSLFMNNNETLNNIGFFTIAPNGGLSRTSGTPTINNSGEFTVSSGAGFSLINTTMNNNRSLLVNGSITIAPNSLLINDNTMAPTGVFRIQNSASLFINNAGELRNVQGTIENNGTVDNSGVLNNESIFFNSNSLTNTAGSTLTNNGVFQNFISGAITNSGAITSNGLLNVSGSITNNSGATITNGGTLTQTGSIFNFFGGTITNTNSGALSINDDLFNNQGTLDNLGMITIAAAGALANVRITTNNGTIINNGTLTNINTTNNHFTNNGTLTNNSSFTNNGNFSGINTTHTGAFNNTGILSPGNATSTTGTYTLNNDYTHNNSTLNIELGSTSVFDQVVVAGTANLSGTLSISLLNGFIPSVGDSFTILTATNVTGSFDTTNLPANVVWDIIYTPTSVIATISSCATKTTYTIAGGWDNGAPTSSARAIIAEDYNTSTMGLGDITACELIVNTDVILSVAAGDFISVENNITINGTLNVAHEGSVVQVDAAALTINNGSITVSKTTPNLAEQDFMIMGSPMSAETREGVYGNGNRVLGHLTGNFVPNADVELVAPGTANWADDNGDNWTNHTGVVNPGEGYLIKPQSVANPTGVFDLDYTLGTLNNGIVNYSALFNGTQNGSPNMIGNPYPSAIEAITFLDANFLIVDGLFFWEHLTPPSNTYPGHRADNFSMGDISMFNYSGGMPAANGGTAPTQFISSGQGFGIKAFEAGTIQFNNTMRVKSNNDTYRASEVPKDRIWLNVFNETYGLGSTTLVSFFEGATEGYENKFDAKRIATPVSIYSKLSTDEELGIQGREAFAVEDEVQIGFASQVEESQEFKISVSDIEKTSMPLDLEIYLRDNELGTISDITNSSYSFTSSDGTFSNRFTLLFKSQTLGTDGNELSDIVIVPNPSEGVFRIVATNSDIEKVEIIDLLGRVISSENNVNNKVLQIDISKEMSAVYFVKIYTSEGITVKQIIKQ